MELIKREHQYSEIERVYEVLDINEVIEIAENIDFTEVQRELIGMAFDNAYRADYMGEVVAELSVRTGELIYYYDAPRTETLRPNLYVTIGSESTDPRKFEWDYKDVLDTDQEREFESIIEDENHEFFEDEASAFEFILEKYDLDEEELVRNYFVENDAEYVEIAETSKMIDEIKEIYSEESIIVNEN